MSRVFLYVHFIQNRNSYLQTVKTLNRRRVPRCHSWVYNECLVPRMPGTCGLILWAPWSVEMEQSILFEQPHDKTNKMTCTPSEDSDQSGHQPSLIRVFAVRMKKAEVPSYPLSAQNDVCAQRRLRSVWASAQFDKSLRCPHEGSWGP